MNQIDVGDFSSLCVVVACRLDVLVARASENLWWTELRSSAGKASIERRCFNQ